MLKRDQWITGLDLAATANFAEYGANAPRLSYDQTFAPQDTTDLLSGYKVTIGPVSYMVNFTYGGHGNWRQLYVTKIGESHYILPIQWNERTQEWVPYQADDWYDENDLPLYQDATTLAQNIEKKASFERRCIGCHSAGITLAYDVNSGYSATYTEQNTTCLRCHGPEGPLTASECNRTGIDVSKLNRDQRLELCGQCHSSGYSVGTAGGSTFDFPLNADLKTYEAGDNLSDYYVIYNMENMPAAFWPDSTSRSNHQQLMDFKRSTHYTNSSTPMECTTCHDPHQAPGSHQVRTEIATDAANDSTLVITTAVDNNTLCLACHAADSTFTGITKEMVMNLESYADTIGKVVSAHTHHPYDPVESGTSRCINCHMPKMATSAIPHDIRSHTFKTVLPEETLRFKGVSGGMPNSCALSCHRESNLWNIVDNSLSDWAESTDTELALLLDDFVKMWWSVPADTPGDLNSDGTVNIFDLLELLRKLGTGSQDAAADVNKDGTVNVFDLLAMLKILTGSVAL
ncbi:MAG TPA: dockerin type I domain-containing protein [archaeon]|nr:dockerin type I domain-containing protein [archaeon]